MQAFAVPAFTTKQMIDTMLQAQAQFFRWGITTIHDMAVTSKEMTVYQQLQKEENFRLKTRLWL